VLAGIALGMAMVLGGAWAWSRRGDSVAPPTSPAPAVPAAPQTPPVAVTGPVAPPTPAATVAAPLTPRLTREDSLAIAAAVERRLAQEERERRAKAEKAMSPAEVEALKARAWARYADSMSEHVRRQFGPEFSRDIARELRRAGVGGNQVLGQVPDQHGGFQRGGAGGGGATGKPGQALLDLRVPEGTVLVPLPPEARAEGGRGRLGGAGGRPMAPGAVVTMVAPAPGGVVGANPALVAPIVGRIAAQVTPPKAGVHRVVVLDMENSTGRPELGSTATAATSAIQKALAGMDGFELADANATRLSLAAGLRSGAVAAATLSGAALWGNVVLDKRGQVVYLVQVYDARRGYPRVLRITRPVEDATGGEMGELVNKVAETLRDWVKWEGGAGQGAG
jgi:hypothetical protein